MASGLFALLDDVAAIAKVAASTLDDVAAQTIKAGGKAAGIVIDDAAVTPRYVVGFAAHRELSIIGRIAAGSLRNKLLFLLPAALALSAFAPWAINPILMLGGIYLAYEGAEKFIHLFQPPHQAAAQHVEDILTGDALEKEKISGAIRTDLILSAEIMAIAIATIESPNFLTRAVTLAVVGIAITVAVYGAVAIIVKADDVGAALARGPFGPGRLIGRGLVKGMPPFLSLLSIVGTVAMLWVGGGILIHGLAEFGWHAPEHLLHDVAVTLAQLTGSLEPITEWLLTALGSGIVGFVVGIAVIGVLHLVRRTPASAH